MKNVQLIVELNDGMYWGRIEGVGKFTPNGAGATVEELIANVRESISDYQDNEGKEDKAWSKADANTVEFEILYDVQAFFEKFSAVKINAIAKMAGINRGLLQNYANGVKHPSLTQVQKIEDAVHQLGKDLSEVHLVAIVN